MLKKKIALVTGGGRGIGRAAAILLSRQGALVTVCSRSEKEIDETAQLVAKNGGWAKAIVCDVGDEKQIAGMFEEIKKEHGRLDILVNNAAIFSPGPMEHTTTETFRNAFNVNCTGTFVCCKEALKLMKDKGGSIVNISSLSGLQAVEKFPGFGSYVVSKFGVTGLTEALAVEWKEYGIRVNVICPGAVDTEMLQKAAPDIYPRLTPSQVAKTIVFLAGPESSGISGAIIPLYSHLMPGNSK